MKRTPGQRIVIIPGEALPADPPAERRKIRIELDPMPEPPPEPPPRLCILCTELRPAWWFSSPTGWPGHPQICSECTRPGRGARFKTRNWGAWNDRVGGWVDEGWMAAALAVIHRIEMEAR